MQAFAAEQAAGAAAHAEPFYVSATFWVALAFITLLLLIGKKVFRMAAAGLDDRAATIKQRLDEADRLRAEAQELLAANQRRQREAAAEAEQIINRARQESERLQERSVRELENSLKRRRQLAMDRIAQAEARALDDVRTAAADVALRATQSLLQEAITDKKADAMIDSAIKDLPEKLH